MSEVIPEGFWGDLLPDGFWGDLLPAVMGANVYGLVLLLILVLLAVFLWAVPPRRIRR